MRANYRNNAGRLQKKVKCFSEEELQDFVNTEWEKHKEEVYKIATRDVSAQILAVMFATLYQPPYNWREKRLKDLKERVEFTFNRMSTGVLGKDFGTVDCLEFLKNELGIDFDNDNMYHKQENIDVEVRR